MTLLKKIGIVALGLLIIVALIAGFQWHRIGRALTDVKARLQVAEEGRKRDAALAAAKAQADAALQTATEQAHAEHDATTRQVTADVNATLDQIEAEKREGLARGADPADVVAWAKRLRAEGKLK